MMEREYPAKFIYPSSRALTERLKKKGIIGKSEIEDQFYALFAKSLGGVWSPVYIGMGIAESLAWETTLKEVGVKKIGEYDFESFFQTVVALRDKKSANKIIRYRQLFLKRRRGEKVDLSELNQE